MKALLSIALVGWFFAVLFLVNRAKATNCVEGQSIVNPSSVIGDSPIISFNYHSHLPDTSSAFHYLRDSLLRALGSEEKMLIVGNFTKAEEQADKNLGLKRANAMRSLFEGHINLNRIEIDSKLADSLTKVPLFIVNPEAYYTASVVDSITMTSGVENEKLGVTTSKVSEEKIPPESNSRLDTDMINDADYVVYFDENSSEIKSLEEVTAYVEELSRKIKKSKAKVEIHGYDDNSRSKRKSMALVKSRTWKVRKVFKDNYVRRNLVVMKNIGQLDSSNSADSLAKNRRVEIHVLNK